MKKSKKSNNLELIKRYIREAAGKSGVSPAQLTPAQFWMHAAASVSEWEVRKRGGFNAVKDSLFPSPSQIVNVQKKKYRRPPIPKLENFTVHEVGLAGLFKKLNRGDVLRVVVQPDTHAPDHDKPAVEAFCQFLDKYKPHGLINLGDFTEMESVSHWGATSAKPRRLVPDLKIAKSVRQQIDDAAGKQVIYKGFLTGNHEFWLQDYLNQRIPEVLDGIEELGVSLNFEDLIGLKQAGYEVIPLNEILRFGNAHFIHGYYTGQHHAAKHLQVFGVNIYYGHIHDVQCHSGVSVKGVHEAASLGCLRQLNAPFMRGKPNNWTHAFGVFEFRPDGSYTRYVPMIIDGRFSFNGQMYGK